MCLRTVVAILFFLFAPVSFLSEASTFSSTVKEHTLANGLKVLVIEDHKAPLATFQVWYRVGSRNEPVGKTGMSHLLEHMMFKGTPTYGSKVFSNIIQRNGGTDNAFTTKDYTMYFQTLSADRIGLSVELEADRMVNLLLNPADVKSERSVVMEERRTRYDDDPQNAVFEETLAAAFKAHPYHWPVIGWMADIASINREDLYDYYHSYYAPNNAFIVVSGGVKEEAILAEIRDKFEKIPPHGTGVPPVTSVEPPQPGERRVEVKKEAELPFVLMAYHVPSFSHPDSLALEVLSTILSDGKSSRLYRSLVYEQRIALSAFADYSGLSKDPFVFLLGATVAPGKESDEVERALSDQIEGIKTDVPGERELQKAKNQIEASFIFAQDSNYSKALYTGMFEIIGGWRLMDDYLDSIRKVTAEEVQAVAKKYFSNDLRTVGVLRPVKAKE
ncbi:MAG TPA: pitrilysin family protein [Dissulfurispiraceae bacterium]|nr:pitrilysin family protein [Dissulfurispiraceae bacterium]